MYWLKNVLKKTAPFQWLLRKFDQQNARLENILLKIKDLKDKNSELELKLKVVDKKNKELDRKLTVLDKKLRKEMEYLYYKGLHPDQYADNLKEWFKRKTGANLNLEHPKTFNEKIQWMKLFDSSLLKTQLTDKWLVRKWVSDKIGDKYLIPLLGKGLYENFEDIDFELLPAKFVIKTTHSCGANLIVTDKSPLKLKEVKDFITEKLNHNYAFQYGLELQYKDIQPRIIIEEYIETNDDFKVFCFNGKAVFIEYMTNREKGVQSALYDLQWNLLPFMRGSRQVKDKIDAPTQLKELIYIAEKLSNGFPHVRVDLYCVASGGIKFGEMTFTTASGVGSWNPKFYDRKFGDLINLPIDKPEFLPVLYQNKRSGTL